MELGNQLNISHIALKEFHDLLRQQVPSLVHIKVDTVQVVDHLGRILPVPLLFCSTWTVAFVSSTIGQLTYASMLGIQPHHQRLLQRSPRKSLCGAR